MGHSAGAYNAAMLALDPRWLAPQGMDAAQLAGWVGLAGPYDFLPSNNPDVQPVFHHPAYPQGAEPFEHVSDGAPPAFLGAARSDALVDPQQNTARLARDLCAAGVPVTLKFYERVGHMTLIGAFGRPLRSLAPVLQDVADFVLENSGDWLRARNRPASRSCRTAQDRQFDAGDVARTRGRGQEHERRCDLLGLCGPAHRRVRAEFRHLGGGTVRHVERRPHRAGRDAR